MIPYRGIVAALGITTHDNVPKVVIISQGDSGKEPRDTHQEVPREDEGNHTTILNEPVG